MRFLILILLPVFGLAQTVPVKDKRIVYEGGVMFGASKQQVVDKLAAALPAVISDYKFSENTGGTWIALGALDLPSEYPVRKSISYQLMLKPVEGGYEYVIDSVKFIEHPRGEKIKEVSSEDVLDIMGETGRQVGEAERLLNQADMYIQRMLATLRQRMI